jgi:hypothetical protein
MTLQACQPHRAWIESQAQFERKARNIDQDRLAFCGPGR